MNDNYVYIITALLPLSALMVVLQVNPYNALVVQGILGAVAALVFAVLGAADVALTQALMGTFLAVTLYAIAVRSSLVLRLGVIADGEDHFQPLMEELRRIFRKHYVRIELVTYINSDELNKALIDKEIHVTCNQGDETGEQSQPYHTVTRIQRIYEIINAEISSPLTTISYVNLLE